MEIKKIFKAGMGYIIGGLLIKGISFITTPIFTRLLSPEQFGILNSYLSFESILSMIIGFQFAASLKSSKIEFKNKESIDTYFSTLLLQVIFHCGIILITCNVFLKYFLLLFKLSNPLLLNLLILNSCGTAIISIYNAKVSLFYEYKKYLTIGIINSILNVFLSLLLIYTIMSDERSIARILGYAVPCILLSAIIVIISFVKKMPNIRPFIYTKFSYKYCLPLMPNGFSEVMLGQFGKIMVDTYCGSSSMGIYSLAFNVYSIMGIIRLALDYIVGPFYFDNRIGKDYHKLRNIIAIYNRVLCYVSLLIVLFTPEIIRILGTQEYYDARFSAVFLVVASFFVFLVSSISQEIYYLKKTYWISIISVLTLAINVALNILLIPKIDVLGAAITTLLSYFGMICLYFIIVKIKYKCDSYSSINIIYVVVMSLIGAIVTYFVMDQMIIRIALSLLVILLFMREIQKLLKVIKKEK